jgi:hypothetical protein
MNTLNLSHSWSEISHVDKKRARKSYLVKYKNKKPLNRGVSTAVNIKET